MPTKPSFLSQLLGAFRASRPVTKPTSPPTTTSTATTQQTYTTLSPSRSSPRAIPKQTTQTATSAALNHQRTLSSSPPRSPTRTGQASPPQLPRRRGSSSSSEGFREVRKEGWYIGGRTAGGEERFLRLGMVRRSLDFEGSSVDKLSL